MTNMNVNEALDKSIEKWEKIVRSEGVDKGVTDCALCELFDKKPSESEA